MYICIYIYILFNIGKYVLGKVKNNFFGSLSVLLSCRSL